MAELTPQQVDCILYNLRTWRRLVNLMQPRTSSSVVTLPVSHSRDGSAVERVAVKRAVVTEVLDKAEEVLSTLTKDQRRIARMKYDDRMSVREIAWQLTRMKRRSARRRGKPEARTISKSWVATQVDLIRVHCSKYLSSVSEEFWGEIWTLELRNRGQRA